jgi:hypothetical protein
MPESPLVKKLKLKPSQRIALIRAPEGYLDTLGPLPEGSEMETRLTGAFDWVMVFVKDQAELEELLPRAARCLKPVSLLWIAFPKGTSELQTDLTRDKGWESVQKGDLKWVGLISLDETWSAFALRPHRPREARQAW